MAQPPDLGQLIKKLGLLRRLSAKLTFHSKLIFFKSLVIPHFDYCATVLFLFNESQKKDLQILQNKFLRIILQLPRDSSSNAMLERLDMLNTTQLINKNVIKFLFKIETKTAPEYLHPLLVKRSETCVYNVRSRNMFTLKKYKKNLTQNSLFYKGVKLYNEFKAKTIENLTLSRLNNEIIMFVKIH